MVHQLSSTVWMKLLGEVYLAMVKLLTTMIMFKDISVSNFLLCCLDCVTPEVVEIVVFEISLCMLSIFGMNCQAFPKNSATEMI